MEHPTQTKFAGQPPVVVLTRRDIAGLMTPADYRHAVARAFVAAAEGRATCPAPMHITASGGGFHVKGAGFAAGELTPQGRAYAAFKVNGNFPGNPARGLPTIQGALVLCDGESGSILALMDSLEITLNRTAAATAVAAQHLARRDSEVITVCGCGDQAPAQLRALCDVLPLRRGFAWDRDRRRAERFARVAAGLGVDIAVADELSAATRGSDVIVTCTTAAEPFLRRADVREGAFVAAVGADWPTKSEIAPDLMAAAAVYVDDLDQCLAMGDLRHAVAAGLMAASDVRGDLAGLAAGKAVRSHAAEITLFDSTGVAIQDVASAALLFEKAAGADIGRLVPLGLPAEASS